MTIYNNTTHTNSVYEIIGKGILYSINEIFLIGHELLLTIVLLWWLRNNSCAVFTTRKLNISNFMLGTFYCLEIRHRNFRLFLFVAFILFYYIFIFFINYLIYLFINFYHIVLCGWRKGEGLVIPHPSYHLSQFGMHIKCLALHVKFNNGLPILHLFSPPPPRPSSKPYSFLN